MRRLLCVLVLVAGCEAANDHPDITADLACETAVMTIRIRGEMAPAPASDACQRCGGRGTIGDGAAIAITCPDCKGTGKK